MWVVFPLSENWREPVLVSHDRHCSPPTGCGWMVHLESCSAVWGWVLWFIPYVLSSPSLSSPSQNVYNKNNQMVNRSTVSMSSVKSLRYTISVKSLDTHTHSTVFLYFYYFLHCRIIVKTSTLWNDTYGFFLPWIMNHVVTKKVLNKSKYILYLRFFKVATLCLDGSFAHSWHSLK